MKSLLAVAAVRGAVLTLTLAIAGCSTTEGLFSSEKVDYRSQAGKTQALDVPPDLTQMARDGRYQTQGGVVSASTLRQPGSAAPATAAAGTAGQVAPTAVGEVRLVRDGSSRWLVSPESPDKLYPLLRNFWVERGFVMAIDSPEVGVMETDWAENRAKLPQDVIRRTLGRVMESFYSTGERDRFRTRIERGANGGSEIYITHKGMEEVYDSARKENTLWQPRPRDPELEAEFISRLMVRLGGGREDQARQAVAATNPAAAAATGTRPSALRPAGALPANARLEVAEGFDRAWRQVGLSLDRSGFTVEDRDRTAGLYFVRYVDPKLAGKEEPNFLQRLLGADKDARPSRYRVLLKADGAQKTQVSVQNSQGEPDNSEAARQIIGRLMDDLKP